MKPTNELIESEMMDIVERLRMHDDERLYEEADRLMSEAADEIIELRAFKAACEEQEAMAELDDGFYHCPKCGVVDAKDHVRSDDTWCTYDAKWIQGPFYIHPDPESTQLRIRIQELESENEILKGEIDYWKTRYEMPL